MKAMRQFGKKRQLGASNIELVVLVVIIGVLIGLIALTHNGIDAKQDNNERQRDIDELRVGLEAYFSQYKQYPTLNNVNDPAWRSVNMKAIDKEVMRDPGGSSYSLSSVPAKNIYAYHVTSTSGKACDNVHTICTEYTLTATLDGGGTYVKNNLD
jgi:type II secretory pathway pseudopilin PulG